MSSIGERSMHRISLVILAALFLINVVLCVTAWSDKSRTMGATLYGLNALTMALMGGTIFFPSFFLKKDSLIGTLESALVAVIAMTFTCTALVSCVITFGDNFSADGPVIFVSSIIGIVAYVAYIACLHQEKTWSERAHRSFSDTSPSSKPQSMWEPSQ